MTILSELLKTERYHQRTPRSSRGSFAGLLATIPSMLEIELSEGVEDPLLVSNMRGQFLVSRKSRTNCGRFGFSEIPLEEEDALILELIQSVRKQPWGTCFTTFERALEDMQESPTPARFLVCAKGSEIQVPPGVTLLQTGLPEGVGLLSSDRDATGLYTRVGNFVGLMIQNASNTLRVIHPAV